MKHLTLLVLSIFAPAALANSVTICKDDQILISSNSVQIISQSHDSVKVYTDCNLKLSPDSKVVVKNQGRRINKDSRIRVQVDNKTNVCSVVQIA
jgi:hypothetical protein